MTNTDYNNRPVNIDYFQPHGQNSGRSSRTLAGHIKTLRSDLCKAKLDRPFQCHPHGTDILVSAYGQPVGLMYSQEFSPSYLESQLNQTT